MLPPPLRVCSGGRLGLFAAVLARLSVLEAVLFLSLLHTSSVSCVWPRCLWLQQTLQALESPAITKQEGCWPACCDALIRGAVLHEQLDFVAAALMERARKHEHVPPLAAQAAKYAEEKYNSTQLVSPWRQSKSAACVELASCFVGAYTH